MLSQNVAKITVPSHTQIRTNLPQRRPQNQWEGVYYFSGITKRLQSKLLFTRLKLSQQALAVHSAASARLIAQHQREFSTHFTAGGSKHMNGAPSDASGAIVLSAALQKSESIDSASQLDKLKMFRLAVELNEHGLVDYAAPIAYAMHQTASLSSAQYASLIKSCAAPTLKASLLVSHTQSDPALVFKVLADRRGADRASLARKIFSLACDVLAPRNEISICHFNALMETLLTCGFSNAAAVSTAIYDKLGESAVAPNAYTYELVLTSLALQGNVAEAEHVLNFMQSQHGAHVTIGHYNAMMLAYREAKAYDRCDQLWQELFDRKSPRAGVETAELYLRSIVDNSYQRMSDTMNRNGNINVVEKKKVPLVLSQMEELSIPRSHLSRPLLDEVEDALRKYSISQHRFYEWGRAVKQFNFIEYRRRYGWMQDMKDMIPPTQAPPPVRNRDDKPDSSYAPVSGMELPGHISERSSWELPALDNILNTNIRAEKMEDVRNGDFYYDDRKSIHDRSVSWIHEVPQTRYNQLYGAMNPNIAKVGIRKHLDGEYASKQEVVEKDASVLRKALSGGRRVRQKVEMSKSHRNSTN